MLLSGSRVCRLALFLSFSAFVAPLSPATFNVPPARAPQTPLALTSQQQDQLHDVVTRVLKHADKAGCKKNTCTILVANFTDSSGSSSILGLQLADEVSKDLVSQQNVFRIIERSRLRDYLEQERISEALLHTEKAMRWLGKQLGATAILTGETRDEGASVRVETILRSCDKEKAGPNEAFTFPYSGSKASLAPIVSTPKAAAVSNVSTNPPAFRAGMGGTGAPVCTYCPPPSYTDPARAAKLNGTALLDVVVSANGETESATIVKGLPFGLNEKAIEAIHQWKFKPATRNGQPVPVMVMIEVTFRLY
jgi:TonB family protein